MSKCDECNGSQQILVYFLDEALDRGNSMFIQMEKHRCPYCDAHYWEWKGYIVDDDAKTDDRQQN